MEQETVAQSPAQSGQQSAPQAVTNQPSGNNQDDSGQPPTTSKALSWSSFATVIAALGTIGGLVFHLMGYISHHTYLSAWGIDPGLFPKATDATIIDGFYAFIDRSAMVMSAIQDGAGKFLTAGVMVAVYLFVLFRAGKSERAGERARWLSNSVPAWLGDVGRSLMLTFLTIFGIPVALVFIVFVLAIPAVFAERFGYSQAEREMAKFLRGCELASGVGRCVELQKDGKTIARGFLIESSESHVALFDVAMQRARAIERAGTELHSGTQVRTPAGHKGAAVTPSK